MLPNLLHGSCNLYFAVREILNSNGVQPAYLCSIQLLLGYRGRSHTRGAFDATALAIYYGREKPQTALDIKGLKLIC